MSNITVSPKRRYDPSPIIRIAAQQCRKGLDPATHQEMADFLGVHLKTLTRWMRGEHLLTEEVADRVTLKLGLHLLNVWPNAYDDVEFDDIDDDWPTPPEAPTPPTFLDDELNIRDVFLATL